MGGLNYTQLGLRCARASCLGGAPRRDFLDLSFAFESWMASPVQCEWRTSFYLPVFIDDLRAFKTTRPSIQEALPLPRADPLSARLEIEHGMCCRNL